MGCKASRDTKLWDPSEMPLEKQLWPEQRTLFDKVPPESTEENTPMAEHPTVVNEDEDADEPPSLNKKWCQQQQAKEKRENEKYQSNHLSVEAIRRTDNEANRNFNDDIVSMANIASSIKDDTLNASSPSSDKEKLKDDRQQQREESSPINQPRHAASRRESHGLVQPMMPPTRGKT